MSRPRPRADAPVGGLVVDKPGGPTSHDVVAAARRALGQPRVGHTGTLDPMATGVLVLLLGAATRLARFLAADEKTYLATVRVGQSTSTGDAAGEPTGPLTPVELDPLVVERALDGLRGPQLQVPPEVSAKQIGGRRAYDLARAGTPVPLAPAAVEARELTLLSCAGPVAELRVRCSAGYYVRALARDLGASLGVGAHLTALRRERSGRFGLDRAVGFDLLVGAPERASQQVIPAAALLDHLPAVQVDLAGAARVGHGQALGTGNWLGGSGQALPEGQTTRILGPDGRLIAVAGVKGGLLHPVLVLV